MNCMNETVTIQCLQEVCFSKSSEYSGAGGSIAAGVIVTALIAAAISVIIHLSLCIWFYRPRMGKGRRTGAKKKSKEIYVVTYGISTQSDGIEITPNVMHRVSILLEMRPHPMRNVESTLMALRLHPMRCMANT